MMVRVFGQGFKESHSFKCEVAKLQSMFITELSLWVIQINFILDQFGVSISNIIPKGVIATERRTEK